MNGRRLWFSRALPLGALVLAGCHHCGTQACYPPPLAVQTAGILPAHPLTPCQAQPLPPPATPTPPALIASPPSGGAYQPLPPSGGAGQPMPPGPPPEPARPPSVSLGGPIPAGPEPQRESARLGSPQSPEPPRAAPQKPDGPDRPRRSPELPVGIANFAEALPDVASGLRPMLDGLDWLKTNGYRAVLQVRAPGENADADRQLLERRGLKYLTLEVSPATLTPAVVDEFNKLVTDPANRPLFVYDRDGSLAGALWYLHFRTAGKLPDEEARKKAAALGLKEDADGAPREMWLGVQKFLRDQEKK